MNIRTNRGAEIPHGTWVIVSIGPGTQARPTSPARALGSVRAALARVARPKLPRNTMGSLARIGATWPATHAEFSPRFPQQIQAAFSDRVFSADHLAGSGSVFLNNQQAKTQKSKMDFDFRLTFANNACVWR
jgi:hypothetical protein